MRVMPVPPNEGMKLTRPEHIGASQLVPGVRRTREPRQKVPRCLHPFRTQILSVCRIH